MIKTHYKIIVYYDSWCPLCVKVKNNIKRLDVFNNVKMFSIREPNIEDHGIPLHLLEKKMYAKIIKNDKTVSGIYAFLAITSNVPLLLLLWPLLKLSVVIGIGEKIYNFIAKSRVIVPVGHCENNSCEIKTP